MSFFWHLSNYTNHSLCFELKTQTTSPFIKVNCLHMSFRGFPEWTRSVIIIQKLEWTNHTNLSVNLSPVSLLFHLVKGKPRTLHLWVVGWGPVYHRYIRNFTTCLFTLSSRISQVQSLVLCELDLWNMCNFNYALLFLFSLMMQWIW